MLMTGSRLIVLAAGISVSGVETWVWNLATRHSGRGDEAGLSTRYPSFVRLPAWPVTIIRLRRPCLRNRNGAKRSGNFWVMAGPPNTLIFNNGCLRPVTKITPERFPPQVRAHVYVPGIFPLCSQVLRGRLRILAPPVDAASSLRYTWPHSAMPVMAAFMVAEY